MKRVVRHLRESTGIRHGQVRFCLERREKAPICAELGVSLFVDDRLDVLAAMTGVVPHRLQFGVSTAPRRIVPVPTWTVAEEAIRAAAAP